MKHLIFNFFLQIIILGVVDAHSFAQINPSEASSKVETPIRLFQNHKPVENYDKLIEDIIDEGVGSGHTLQFSDETKLFHLRLFRKTSSSVLFMFSDDEQLLLRVSRRRLLSGNLSGLMHLNGLITGFELLHKYSAPTVKVFTEKSVLNEYVIHERLRPPANLKKLYSLDDFINEPQLFDKQTYQIMSSNLVEFAKATAVFESIGDQNNRQILYTDKGWVLADFNEKHKVWNPSSSNIYDTSIFGDISSWASSVGSTEEVESKQRLKNDCPMILSYFTVNNAVPSKSRIEKTSAKRIYDHPLISSPYRLRSEIRKVIAEKRSEFLSSSESIRKSKE